MPPTCCAFELGMPPVRFDSDTPCRSAGSDVEYPFHRRGRFPKGMSPVLPRPPRARRFRTRRQQPRVPSTDVIQFPEFATRLQLLDCKQRRFNTRSPHLAAPLSWLGRPAELVAVVPTACAPDPTSTRCLSPTSATDFSCHEHPIIHQTLGKKLSRSTLRPDNLRPLLPPM
jgi:hypothetical protein